MANIRTVPLPSDNSDGDKKYWPDDPMQTIKPQDFYYHEVLAKLCNDLLPAGTSTLGLFLFHLSPLLLRFIKVPCHLSCISCAESHGGSLAGADKVEGLPSAT